RIVLELLTFSRWHKKMHPLEFHRITQGVFPMSILRGALQYPDGLFNDAESRTLDSFEYSASTIRHQPAVLPIS
ncbi:hypothetical protein ACWGPW_28335, partial [Paenibacillus chitinolyticus]